jgi:hypothetical protein
MNTKLTLTIEDFVIEKAKNYARQEGRSLSDLVENYLKAITSSTEIKEVELSPVVKSLRGSFKAPDDMDYKEELARRLSEKYLE